MARRVRRLLARGAAGRISGGCSACLPVEPQVGLHGHAAWDQPVLVTSLRRPADATAGDGLAEPRLRVALHPARALRIAASLGALDRRDGRGDPHVEQGVRGRTAAGQAGSAEKREDERLVARHRLISRPGPQALSTASGSLLLEGRASIPSASANCRAAQRRPSCSSRDASTGRGTCPAARWTVRGPRGDVRPAVAPAHEKGGPRPTIVGTPGDLQNSLPGAGSPPMIEGRPGQTAAFVAAWRALGEHLPGRQK